VSFDQTVNFRLADRVEPAACKTVNSRETFGRVKGQGALQQLESFWLKLSNVFTLKSFRFLNIWELQTYKPGVLVEFFLLRDGQFA